jgi:PKD repeat protein
MGMGMGGVTISFDGSGSVDPTNQPTETPENMNFLWLFGNGIQQQGIGLATPSNNYGQAGCYNGSLTVTNSVGSDTVDFQVSVTFANGTGGCP